MSVAPEKPLPLPSLLSVVVPLYNEQEIVGELCRRILQVVRGLGCPFELVLVDDGSRDQTRARLLALTPNVPEMKIVCLSRNFGLQGAVAAGLSQATGNAVVLMDGDLQDPPELIAEMLKRWRMGAEVVFTVKRSRQERGLRALAFPAFHALFRRLGPRDMPLNAGNFSLMDRRALDAINQLGEHNRYLPGLRTWVGFRQEEVVFDRQERAAGEPRMTLGRLVRLALDGIFGFSYLPLRVATVLGLGACMLGLGLVIWVLVERFITHTAILGWPSLMVAICFLGGVQLVSIGILGEYLGRIYDEVRGRPNFLVSEVIQSRPREPA